MREGSWIDTRGHVHMVNGITHETFAKEVLKKAGRKPSLSAKAAYKASRFGRYDAGPAFFQLLQDGWVRQRGCDFTVWRFNGPTAMSIAIGAKNLWCPEILAEACNDRGCKDVRRWSSVSSMVEDFNGLRGMGRRKSKPKARKPARKSCGCGR